MKSPAPLADRTTARKTSKAAAPVVLPIISFNGMNLPRSFKPNPRGLDKSPGKAYNRKMPTEDFTLSERIRVLEARLAYLEKELTLILKEYNSKLPSDPRQSKLPLNPNFIHTTV